MFQGEGLVVWSGEEEEVVGLRYGPRSERDKRCVEDVQRRIGGKGVG